MYFYLVTETNIEAVVPKVRPIFDLNALKYAVLNCKPVAFNLYCTKVIFY